MGFRRLPVEERTYDNSEIGAMRDISDLVREESALSDRRKQEAFDRGLAMEKEGRDALIGGIQRGVEGFVANRRQARRDDLEERRLDKQEERADKQTAMQEEEFNLKKPELEAQGRTAAERAEAEIAGRKAGTRSAEAQAAQAEAETAYNTAPSRMKDAVQGESNFAYNQRKAQEIAMLDADIRRAETELKGAELAEFKANAGLRKQQLQASIDASRAGIAASNASTRATNVQTDQAVKSQKIAELKSRVQGATTLAQAQQAMPELARLLESKQITPAEANEVVASINNDQAAKALQQQLINNANPEYGYQVKKDQEARDTAASYLSNIGLMKNALKNNSANAIFDDKGAKEQFASALEAMGMSAEAKSVMSSFGENDITDPVSTDARMKMYLNKAIAKARATFNDPELQKNPKVQEMLTALNNLSSDGAKPSLVPQGGPIPAAGPGPGGAPQPAMAQPMPSKNARPRAQPAANFGGK